MSRTSVNHAAGWRNALIFAGMLVLMLLLTLTLYTLAHEGGHALVGLALGGKITSFSINFFNLSAHAGLDGDFSPAQRAWISMAGVTLPLLLCMGFLLLAPKGGNLLLRWFKTILFLSTINTLLAWMVIPILVGIGNTIGDDSAGFVTYTRLPPWVVSASALLIYVAGWLVFWKQIGGLGGIRALLRPAAAELSLAEMRGTVLGLALLGGVSAAAGLGLTLAFPQRPFAPPPGYELAAALDLSQRGYADEAVYQFDLAEPAQASFFFALTNVKGGPVNIQLVGPDGYEQIFFASDEADFNAGQASVNPRALALAPGLYQVRVTFQPCRGTVQIYTAIEQP